MSDTGSNKSQIGLRNKRAMMAQDRSPESFSPQMNSTFLFLWFKLVTLGVGPVLIPKALYESNLQRSTRRCYIPKI